MNARREKLLAFALLSIVLLLNAAALWPELTISRVDLNDNVFHYTLIERVVEAVKSGENPLDCWSAEWSLGFPVLRVYQPLAHLLVAAVYFAFGKAVPLMTVFVGVRFLSIVLLPLSFFAAARLLGFSPFAAAAASILAPLVSTDYLYGVEYGSFTWAGSGVYPQALGTHLFLISIGVGYRAIRDGRRWILSGLLVAATLLAHLIYGYMAAVSLLLAAMAPDAVSRWMRLRRLAGVGLVAFAASAFQLIPLIVDGALINHSRWEPVWKWDSYGAASAIGRLVTGELLDHGRLPVLTVLAFCGVALLAWNRRRGPMNTVHAYLAIGAAFWMLMYFGRSFWGPLLIAIGASEDMHLHRVIGGTQLFLVLLGAVALAAAWRELSVRWHWAAAVAVTALLLYPAVRERAQNLANNAEWGRRNLASYAAEKGAIDAAVGEARGRGGRAYAGLEATWGGSFKIGYVPFFAFLSTAQVPTVGFLYHSMALTADVMVRFSDWTPAQYRLFNIRTVIAPVNSLTSPPGLLQPRSQYGRFQVFEAPGGGYFDLVDAGATVKTNRRNFADVNDRWLQSDWPARRTHLLLDWQGHGGAPAGILRLPPEAMLPFLAAPPPESGAVVAEQQSGETYRADYEVSRGAYALFKMTWHPNWKAYVDNRPQPVVMLSPGFPGVALTPGRHRVEFRYEPGPAKAWWAIAGAIAVLLLWRLSKLPARRFEFLEAVATRVGRRWATAAGIAGLALPVCIPLLTDRLLWGHDAYAYFPRVIEVHQNLLHGILLPRWAPDLGGGTGQPLFIFHPPMFYWLSEAWNLAGFGPVFAVNLAAAVIVLASAWGMYRLGSLYFGPRGGWLAASAYLYAPYFAVDLYVRSSMEEFTAFPLLAFALYGFGAYARLRTPRYWVLGAAAFGCVVFSHFPAALLFAPLLVTFLAATAWMEQSWRVLWMQAAGFALGLALSAWSWIPALVERQYIAITRALEGGASYTNHFVYLRQLVSTAWGFGLSVPGPNDGMSFSMGWSHVLLGVVALWWVLRWASARDRRLGIFLALAIPVLVLLMCDESTFVWRHLKLLQYVELPWRLLEAVALCAGLLIAALGPAIQGLRRWRGAAMAAVLALLIVPNLSHLAVGRTAEIDLALWTPSQLAATGFETTTMGEMTPRWRQVTTPYTTRTAAVIAGEATIRETLSSLGSPFEWSGKVQAKAPSRVQISRAYFPGWSVEVDGVAHDAAPAAGSGLIEFTVEPGEHDVRVAWGRSPARRWGEIVSLFGIVVAAFCCWRRPSLGPQSAP